MGYSELVNLERNMGGGGREGERGVGGRGRGVKIIMIIVVGRKHLN